MVDEIVPGGPLADLDGEPAGSDVGELQAFIDEHRTSGIGALWLTLIREAASRTARRYSPVIYARAAQWDEDAIGDLVQDVVERLLSKAQLDYICDVASDFGHARALVYRQVKLVLADRRQRTAVDNLFDRATVRLSEPPFSVIRKKPTTWGLAGVEQGPTEPSRRLVATLAALPRLPGVGAERASAIWTADTLADALTLICRDVGELIEADLKRILDGALTVFATAEVVTDEAGTGSSAGGLAPEEQIMANEAVQRIVAALSPEEAVVLAGKWIGDSDGDIADALGVSRPTAAKYKEAAFTKVRDELVEHDQRFIEVVFGRLQSLVILKAAGGRA
jgi:hypothetical protein